MTSPRKAVLTMGHQVTSDTPGAQLTYKQHRENLMGKAVKTKPQRLLDDFVPDCSGTAQRPSFDNVFDSMPADGTLELNMYTPFATAVNSGGLCPGYLVSRSDTKPDRGDKDQNKVDAALFPRDHAPKDGRPRWDRQVAHFEFKRHSKNDDPFNDKSEDFDDVSSSLKRKNRGQIAAYADKLFQRQHLTCCFTIIILGPCARICRWDRSGVIVTEKFNYIETEYLCEFLWRFSHLSPEQQGQDPSAVRVTEAEAQLMLDHAKPVDGDLRPHAREFFKDSLVEDWPWWKLSIEVCVETSGAAAGTDPVIRREGEYLVGKPRFLAKGVAGRGTRGYVAYDCARERLVWLKDAWRVDHDDIEQEGLILEEIKAESIMGVPRVLVHGDILDQKTYSQDLWTPPKSGPDAKSPLKPHKHYRMVVDEVCLPLSNLRNGEELIQVILDCLLAHEEVYKRLKRLHRDISADNVMIYVHVAKDPKTGKEAPVRMGMLCDWELSKRVDKESAESRQPDRTGTWQFLSVNALEDPYRVITVQDELESFVHIIINYGVRFVRHNFAPDTIGPFIYKYFDTYDWNGIIYHCGQLKKYCMHTGIINNGVEMLKFHFHAQPAQPSNADTQSSVFPVPSDRLPAATLSSDTPVHPLNTILNTCLDWFKAYYALQRIRAPVAPSTSTLRRPKPEDALRPPSRRIDGEDDDDDEDATEAYADSAGIPQEEVPLYMKKAQRLETHAELSKLLRRQLRKKMWPTDDRTDDQLPFDYNFAKDQESVGLGSSLGRTSAAGSKRGSEVDSGFAASGSGASSNKRSRMK